MIREEAEDLCGIPASSSEVSSLPGVIGIDGWCTGHRAVTGICLAYSLSCLDDIAASGTGHSGGDAQATLSQLPLYFVENRGQLDAEVAYSVLGGGTQVYFTRYRLDKSLGCCGLSR